MTLNVASLGTGFDEKPADCTCNYPEMRYRNISGHAPSCPAHVRIYQALGIGTGTPPMKPPAKVPSATYRIHASDSVEMIVIPTQVGEFDGVDFNHEGRLVFQWLQNLPAATYTRVIELIKERQ